MMSNEVAKANEAAQADADVAAEEQVRQTAGGIAIQCQFCAGQNFRRSRWRKGDLKQLLMMRYPVRCLRCSQRQWVSFSVAGISVPSHVKHVPERVAGARRATGNVVESGEAGGRSR